MLVGSQSEQDLGLVLCEPFPTNSPGFQFTQKENFLCVVLSPSCWSLLLQKFDT